MTKACSEDTREVSGKIKVVEDRCHNARSEASGLVRHPELPW